MNGRRVGLLAVILQPVRKLPVARLVGLAEVALRQDMPDQQPVLQELHLVVGRGPVSGVLDLEDPVIALDVIDGEHARKLRLACAIWRPQSSRSLTLARRS